MQDHFEALNAPPRSWPTSGGHEAAAEAATGAPDQAAQSGAGHLVARLGKDRRRWITALGFVLLGDVLFWQQPLGLSVAIFALALVLVAGIGRSKRAQIGGALIGLIGALPVVDHLQALSLLFLATGVIAALVWQQGPGPGRWARQALGFLAALPGQWLRALTQPERLRAAKSALRRAARKEGRGFLRDWAFPLGGSLVFLALILEANPLFLSLSADLTAPWPLLQRMMFWAGIALFVAPLLQPVLPDTPHAPLPPLRGPDLGLNKDSILRALVMFNALIGLQMVSDVAILIGGAALPQGMSYAEYAHRGAYPLLATAMLAMGFALLSRPYWQAQRWIRPLMLLWLAQNIALTAAAALRLDLYIAVYGLTYLRLYALIWMGLVAFGLALAVLQLRRKRETSWLVVRGAAGAAATLYACAFVNFAAIIAEQNLARPDPDLTYVCALGPMAAGALAKANTARGYPPIPGFLFLQQCPALKRPQVQGWRDWGLRSWRVNHNMDAAMRPEPAE